MAFYSDSDCAGNTQPQNKRKNQYGFVALENRAPVDWFSKCTSVASADASIGESHPDVSVGAGEIYAAGNAICEMLQLSYISEEIGVPFPKPAILRIVVESTHVVTNFRNSTDSTEAFHESNPKATWSMSLF